MKQEEEEEERENGIQSRRGGERYEGSLIRMEGNGNKRDWYSGNDREMLKKEVTLGLARTYTHTRNMYVENGCVRLYKKNII